MLPATPLFESCVDAPEAAAASDRGGAGRIELCARLDVGGTTPPAAHIERCAAALAIPLFVMIRPRGGDFVYDASEVEAMDADIRMATAAGAQGLVFGALRPDGAVDAAAMQRLINRARPLPVTCHKAIDASRDPLEALDALLTLGVDRVLTSGGAATAVAGAATIARMVARAGDALVVMAGGGIRAHNVAAILEQTAVREVHARAIPSGVETPPTAADVDAWAQAVRRVVERIV